MTTFYNRNLQRAREQQRWESTRLDTRTRAEQSQRGTSQQAQHFKPASGWHRSRIDWITVLTFSAAVAALTLVVASALAQRERLEKAMLDEDREATLSAVTRAERDGYERAMAEASTAVQAAWRTGVIDGMRACRSTY